MNEKPEPIDPSWHAMERLLADAPSIQAPEDFVVSVMAALPELAPAEPIPFDWLGTSVLAAGFAGMGAIALWQLPIRDVAWSELMPVLQASIPLGTIAQALAWSMLGLGVAYASMTSPTAAVSPIKR